tara:strand:- start:313 stop:993 length:681 start_codon:yes stop_codon:yes gene_type:complete
MDQKPSALSDKKYALYGKRTDKGVPKLAFSVYNGNPSITVFPNDPSDEQNGKPIKGKMDGIIFSTMIATALSVVDSDPGTTKRVELRDGPPNKTFPGSTVIIGRDEEGVVFMGLAAKGRPNKKFELMPSAYLQLQDSQGNVLPKGEVSQYYARGYFNMVRYLVEREVYDTYEPYTGPKGGPGKPGGGYGNNNRGGGNYGNQGGYGGNQGGGQGGYSQPTGGDDLPM